MSDHIALAQLWAVKQLAGWRKEQEASGYSTLSEIPLAGLPEGALISFKRAVFAYAKAILLEQFATIERREAARHDGRENPELSAIFYAHANRAIADILGLSQDCVELI